MQPPGALPPPPPLPPPTNKDNNATNYEPVKKPIGPAKGRAPLPLSRAKRNKDKGSRSPGAGKSVEGDGGGGRAQGKGNGDSQTSTIYNREEGSGGDGQKDSDKVAVVRHDDEGGGSARGRCMTCIGGPTMLRLLIIFIVFGVIHTTFCLCCVFLDFFAFLFGR
uniref:WH2 domain-containing protein n=1 Tax=Panagrellus redivivus TaxID=6233 RepID=A0A7E4UV35_PANRE